MNAFRPQPETTPPRGSRNHHGETEPLGDVVATHWFVEAAGVKWHLVTAGDPSHEAVVFLHGYPESWYAFHHQMRALADRWFVIALDLKGYGQSDKRPGDYSYPAIARELAALLEAIGIETFDLVTHDRGSVVGDHLCAVEGMPKRIRRYVRMQQSGSEPHSDPKPPHRLFASIFGALLNRTLLPGLAYRGTLVKIPIEPRSLERLHREFRYPGVAFGATRSYRTTSFDKELADRHARLFETMSMPLLFLQGRHDPGQQPHEYEHVTDFVANGHLEFVEAGHFLHLEAPEATTAAIRRFLERRFDERQAAS